MSLPAHGESPEKWKLVQTWNYTVISRLCSQLESELFVRTRVVGANLALVLFTASAKRWRSLELMFGDWLMH